MDNNDYEDCRMALVHITRQDGKVARLTLPYYEEDDLWTAIGNEYPLSYDLLDESSILGVDDPAYEDMAVDESYIPPEDDDLALWLAEAMTECRMSLPGSDAAVNARRADGIATVVWMRDGTRYEQTIALNPGDFEKLVLGHDPVAERWEDGCGNLVCLDNAKAVGQGAD